MGDRDEGLIFGYSGRMLLLTSIGWGLILMGRRAFPPLLPVIGADLSLTTFQSGLLLTVLSATYAITQYPSGRLSDELSRKTVLVAGLMLLTLGFAAASLSGNFAALLSSVVVIGLGAGLYPTVARALLSDLYHSRRGQAFGIHTALGDIGSTLAAVVVAAVLVVATWRSVFIPISLLLFVVLLVLLVGSRERIYGRRPALELRSTFARLLGDPSIRTLLAIYSLYVFAVEGVVGFLPTLLQAEKALSPSLASGGFAAFFLVGSVVRPVAGKLADVRARKPIAGAALVISGTALGGLLLVTSPVAIFIAIAAFAIGMKMFPPVMQAHLMDVFPDESMGGDFGAMRTIYIGIGSLGPLYVGTLAARAGYTTAFIGFVACLLCAALLLIALVFRS